MSVKSVNHVPTYHSLSIFVHLSAVLPVYLQNKGVVPLLTLLTITNPTNTNHNQTTRSTCHTSPWRHKQTAMCAWNSQVQGLRSMNCMVLVTLWCAYVCLARFSEWNCRVNLWTVHPSHVEFSLSPSPNVVQLLQGWRRESQRRRGGEIGCIFS